MRVLIEFLKEKLYLTHEFKLVSEKPKEDDRPKINYKKGAFIFMGKIDDLERIDLKKDINLKDLRFDYGLNKIYLENDSKCLSTNNGKLVLEEYNKNIKAYVCMNTEVSKNSRKILGLSGPHYFEFYNTGDKKLLILGETHMKTNIYNGINSEIYEVNRWLFELMKNIPESVDKISLFIEDEVISKVNKIEQGIPIHYNDLKNYNCALESIICSFDSCNELCFEKNPLKRLNYENVDARIVNIFDDNENDESIKSPVSNLHKFFKKLPKTNPRVYRKLRKFISENFTLLFEFISCMNIDEKGLNCYEEFIIETHGILEGEIESYHEFFMLYQDLIEEEKMKIPNFDEYRFYECLYNSYNYDKEYYLSVMRIPMDTYFLLKFLSGEDKYNIFYGGAAHSNIYSLFVQSYFNIEPEISQINNSNYKQYVDFYEPFDLFKGEPKNKKFSYHKKIIEIQECNIIVFYFTKFETKIFKKDENNKIEVLNIDFDFNHLESLTANEIDLIEGKVFMIYRLYMETSEINDIRFLYRDEEYNSSLLESIITNKLDNMLLE